MNSWLRVHAKAQTLHGRWRAVSAERHVVSSVVQACQGDPGCAVTPKKKPVFVENRLAGETGGRGLNQLKRNGAPLDGVGRQAVGQRLGCTGVAEVAHLRRVRRCVAAQQPV